MENALRLAAGPILDKRAAQEERSGIQVTAFTCRKKVFLDFPCTLLAPAFHAKAVALGPVQVPKPRRRR
eukprot:6791638-Pyramimonas_sp.AAC.1